MQARGRVSGQDPQLKWAPMLPSTSTPQLLSQQDTFDNCQYNHLPFLCARSLSNPPQRGMYCHHFTKTTLSKPQRPLYRHVQHAA